MAVAYSTVTQSYLLAQQYPPPLLPKPGKDNVRLQKLLKRSAKKKVSPQAPQSAPPFRSSLSPVNEASPDLEHSDHSTPPKTPESPFYSVPQHQRFTVRPLYQHVASPYPQRAAYGRGEHVSSQTADKQSYISTFSTHPAAGPPTGPKISLPAFSMPKVTTAAAEVKPSAPGTGLKPVIPQQKPTSPAPTPGCRTVSRPLTVLIPFVKSKSPHPTFKATEPSRSPKPMFDVPKIRMYTASTSYYETSRTPPMYDTTGLTAIVSTVLQSQTSTEIKQVLTPTSEVKRGPTPTGSSKDSQRRTPTTEIKTGSTPTAELNRVETPPPTSETKRVKTPTYELMASRTTAGRSKTPAYQVTRAPTPVFEVSRTNPLLFAVSPITVEPERSKTPTMVSAVDTSLSLKTLESQPDKTIPDGNIHEEVKPAQPPVVKETKQRVTKSEAVGPEQVEEKTPTAPLGLQNLKTLTCESPMPEMPSIGCQRPKTPTYEASRLMSAASSYPRPRTPSYGTSPTGVSPVGFQRPKTPTQVANMSKSSYRGLMPAEYVAHGGIKTYSPTFGFSRSKTPTQEEVQTTKEEPAESKTPSQEVPVKAPSVVVVSKVEETPKEEVSTVQTLPIIVVSQAFDTPPTSTPLETQRTYSQVAKKVIEVKPKAVEVKTSEKQKSEKSVQEVPKPKTTLSSEVKGPLSKEDSQDRLIAVRKLMGKDKFQNVTKEVAPEQKEPVKPSAANETKAQSSKPKPVLPLKAAAESKGTEDKEKDVKPESIPKKKEGDVSASAAEPLLLQKKKGLKSKLSGWSRLKKHMVVEQEEPKFPESEKEKSEKDQGHIEKVDEKATVLDEKPPKEAPKANKMWEAVLFQMFSTKENIMHQIELNQSEEEQKEEKKDMPKEIPSFAYRLPVLLFSPKFDAKRLKEAASRPVTKISTVFEMGLIGRKNKEEEPKDFNRTARGFAAS
ncbi:uncharacterized protein prr33 [Genypterus blacodes]|uniref:uncharacterized protein prr33 n=1 Tax=Genypterus blacodes TaxID=154954 RepID=UPI003F76800C